MSDTSVSLLSRAFHFATYNPSSEQSFSALAGALLVADYALRMVLTPRIVPGAKDVALLRFMLTSPSSVSFSSTLSLRDDNGSFELLMNKIKLAKRQQRRAENEADNRGFLCDLRWSTKRFVLQVQRETSEGAALGTRHGTSSSTASRLSKTQIEFDLSQNLRFFPWLESISIRGGALTPNLATALTSSTIIHLRDLRLQFDLSHPQANQRGAAGGGFCSLLTDVLRAAPRLRRLALSAGGTEQLPPVGEMCQELAHLDISVDSEERLAVLLDTFTYGLESLAARISDERSASSSSSSPALLQLHLPQRLQKLAWDAHLNLTPSLLGALQSGDFINCSCLTIVSHPVQVLRNQQQQQQNAIHLLANEEINLALDAGRLPRLQVLSIIGSFAAPLDLKFLRHANGLVILSLNSCALLAAETSTLDVSAQGAFPLLEFGAAFADKCPILSKLSLDNCLFFCRDNTAGPLSQSATKVESHRKVSFGRFTKLERLELDSLPCKVVAPAPAVNLEELTVYNIPRLSDFVFSNNNGYYYPLLRKISLQRVAVEQTVPSFVASLAHLPSLEAIKLKFVHEYTPAATATNSGGAAQASLPSSLLAPAPLPPPSATDMDDFEQQLMSSRHKNPADLLAEKISARFGSGGEAEEKERNAEKKKKVFPRLRRIECTNCDRMVGDAISDVIAAAASSLERIILDNVANLNEESVSLAVSACGMPSLVNYSVCGCEDNMVSLPRFTAVATPNLVSVEAKRRNRKHLSLDVDDINGLLQCQRLKYLNLAQTGLACLDGFALAAAAASSQLETLVLSATPIQTCHALRALPNLRHLSCSYCTQLQTIITVIKNEEETLSSSSANFFAALVSLDVLNCEAVTIDKLLAGLQHCCKSICSIVVSVRQQGQELDLARLLAAFKSRPGIIQQSNRRLLPY